MPSLPDARADFARRQAELLRALRGDAPAPAGFEPAHVERAADSLARKRVRIVQKTWPVTARALGNRFGEHFATYARDNPLPTHVDSDGFHFAQWLRSRGFIPNEGKLELAAWRVMHGFPLRLLFLPSARTFVLVYRSAGAARVARLGRTPRS